MITVVRNDDFYLRKWVEYYGRELGRENLYVFFDGKDQKIPDFCEGLHCSLEEKIPGKVVEMDRRRSAFVSDKAEELFKAGYELVIGVDADEYLVADPASGKSLAGFLSEASIDGSISGLGVTMPVWAPDTPRQALYPGLCAGVAAFIASKGITSI